MRSAVAAVAGLAAAVILAGCTAGSGNPDDLDSSPTTAGTEVPDAAIFGEVRIVGRGNFMVADDSCAGSGAVLDGGFGHVKAGTAVVVRRESENGKALGVTRRVEVSRGHLEQGAVSADGQACVLKYRVIDIPPVLEIFSVSVADGLAFRKFTLEDAAGDPDLLDFTVGRDRSTGKASLDHAAGVGEGAQDDGTEPG